VSVGADIVKFLHVVVCGIIILDTLSTVVAALHIVQSAEKLANVTVDKFRLSFIIDILYHFNY